MSRLGDELQDRADAHPDPDDRETEEVEQEALEAARSKGWDKPVDEIDPPPDR